MERAAAPAGTVPGTRRGGAGGKVRGNAVEEVFVAFYALACVVLTALAGPSVLGVAAACLTAGYGLSLRRLGTAGAARRVVSGVLRGAGLGLVVVHLVLRLTGAAPL